MKTLIIRTAPLAVGAALLVAPLFQAQAAGPKSSDLRARTQTRVQSLVKVAAQRANNLQLTASQQSKLRALAQKNAPVIRAIWNDDSLSQAAKVQKVRSLKNQAQAILTPAQRQKVAAAKGEAMVKLFETASWVSQELDLTPQQQQRLQGIVMTAYRQSGGSNGDFSTLRSLIVDTSGKVDQVLSPAQKAKWSIIKTTARQEIVRQTRSLRQLNRI